MPTPEWGVKVDIEKFSDPSIRYIRTPNNVVLKDSYLNALKGFKNSNEELYNIDTSDSRSFTIIPNGSVVITNTGSPSYEASKGSSIAAYKFKISPTDEEVLKIFKPQVWINQKLDEAQGNQFLIDQLYMEAQYMSFWYYEIDAIQDPNDPLLYYGYTKKFEYDSDTYVNHTYDEYDLVVKDKNLSIYHRGGLLYVPMGSILANIKEYANHYGASKLIDNNESISTKESNYYNYNYYLDTLSPDTSNRSVYVVSRIVEVKPDSNDTITIRKGGFVPYSKDEFGAVIENTTTIYNSGLLNRDNPEFSGSIGVLEFQIFVLGSPTNYSSINNDRVLSLTSAPLNSNHSILTGSVESWSRNLNEALPCGNGIVEKDKYKPMSIAYSGRAKMKLELSKFYPNQGAIGVYYGMDKPIASQVTSDRYISSGEFFANDNSSVNKYLKYVQLEDRVEEVITGVIYGKGGWKYRYKGYYASNPDATSRYFVPTSLIIYCTNTADTSTISSFYFTYTFSHAPKVDIINCSKSEGSMSYANTTISTTYSSYKDRVVFSSGIPATHYIMITGFNDKSVL